MALLPLFIYRPLADNIRLSFFDWNISDPKAQFVGLSNYAEWFTRSDTRQIVLHTAVFTVAAVLGSMVLWLLLAMPLDQALRGRNLVRSAVFAPFVISGAAVVRLRPALRSGARPVAPRWSRSGRRAQRRCAAAG